MDVSSTTLASKVREPQCIQKMNVCAISNMTLVSFYHRIVGTKHGVGVRYFAAVLVIQQSTATSHDGARVVLREIPMHHIGLSKGYLNRIKLRTRDSV